VVMVQGHTPVTNLTHRINPHRTMRSGRLTCLILEGDQTWVI